MPIRRTNMSCGIIEIFGEDKTATPELLKKLYKALFEAPAGAGAAAMMEGWNPQGRGRGAAIFSNQDNRQTDPGYTNWCFQLASYIKKNRLGEVVRSRTWTNPNTGHPICQWTWYFNHQAMEKNYAVLLGKSKLPGTFD